MTSLLSILYLTIRKHNIEVIKFFFLIIMHLFVSIFYLLRFSSCFSEYVKIIDGNGSLVWHKYGYSYSPDLRSFVQVGFESVDNITVQIYLLSSYSRFKLQYGIIKQGLFSG